MHSSSVIKGIRGKRLLSQKNVADMMGISRQTYNVLENDLLNNDFVLMFKLLKTLDLSENETDEFFNALKQDYESYET